MRSLPDSGIARTILSSSCVTDLPSITGQGESHQTKEKAGLGKGRARLIIEYLSCLASVL